MSAKSAINKEVFTPHDEKMLVAVQVKRRTKKKIPFLATGGQGDYMTFICVSDVHRSRRQDEKEKRNELPQETFTTKGCQTYKEFDLPIGA
uniref:Syntaxin binding protein 6 (amisyn) n=1 Tax=Gasterosteus aculeatus aculeatus TaxID=481459 RepID=A0AAQ4P8I0_GASAC